MSKNGHIGRRNLRAWKQQTRRVLKLANKGCYIDEKEDFVTKENKEGFIGSGQETSEQDKIINNVYKQIEDKNHHGDRLGVRGYNYGPSRTHATRILVKHKKH